MYAQQRHSEPIQKWNKFYIFTSRILHKSILQQSNATVPWLTFGNGINVHVAHCARFDLYHMNFCFVFFFLLSSLISLLLLAEPMKRRRNVSFGIVYFGLHCSPIPSHQSIVLERNTNFPFSTHSITPLMAITAR